MSAGIQRTRNRRNARRGYLFIELLFSGVLLLFSGCATSRTPYEGMGAEDHWNAGVAAFEEEEWSQAITHFDYMIDLNAAHPSVPDARIYTARAYEAQEQFILAAEEYQLFLDAYFSHPRAPEASLGVCRANVQLSPIPQRDQTDTQRARDACARTAIEFQGLTVAEEAEAYREQMVERLGERAYQNADFYRRRGQLLSAVDEFEKVVTEHWDTSWAPKAMVARYRIYRELEWAEEAEEEALRLEYNYPESPEARELREELAPATTTADDAAP